jgi:hypothetical protein
VNGYGFSVQRWSSRFSVHRRGLGTRKEGTGTGALFWGIMDFGRTYRGGAAPSIGAPAPLFSVIRTVSSPGSSRIVFLDMSTYVNLEHRNSRGFWFQAALGFVFGYVNLRQPTSLLNKSAC